MRLPYLLWQQHATVRTHAAGRFDDLLRAMARDPAMLVYLDGRSNQARAINENFAREVMELHTIGRGAYTQDDVVAAARAFTGWVMNPGREDRRHVFGVEPWSSFHTVDYRSYYASLLEDWLEVGHEDLLGRRFETLGFLTDATAPIGATRKRFFVR